MANVPSRADARQAGIDDHVVDGQSWRKSGSPKVLQKLIAVAHHALGKSTGPAPVIRTQCERVLYAIARGRGELVPLYETQQNRATGQFIADHNTRIHELRHRFGFYIENEKRLANGRLHSCYRLVLNADGSPRMTPVPLAEGRPADTGSPSKPKKGWKSEPFFFGAGAAKAKPATLQATAPKTAPQPAEQPLLLDVPNTASDESATFLDFERGKLLF